MSDRQEVALVTGASRGIGPIIARRLSRAGYKVIVTGRSKPEIQALAAELGGVAIASDLTRSDDVERLAREAQAVFGRVDVLVNNAGGDPQLEFDAMSWAQNQAIFDLNVVAPIHLAYELLPGMLARRRGHVVNISSIAGRVSFPYTEAYAAAKITARAASARLSSSSAPSATPARVTAQPGSSASRFRRWARRPRPRWATLCFTRSGRTGPSWSSCPGPAGFSRPSWTCSRASGPR